MVFIVSDQFSRWVDVTVAVIALVVARGDLEEDGDGDGVDDDDGDDDVTGATVLERNLSESIIDPSRIESALRSGFRWPFCDDVAA